MFISQLMVSGSTGLNGESVMLLVEAEFSSEIGHVMDPFIMGQTVAATM